MTLAELIDLAVAAKGSRRVVAEGLHQSAQRLTDWKAGRRTPDAHEIAYLAECAGLPVLETVAEIEAQLDERYASIWREALGKLRAAGVAASFILILGILGFPEKSFAGNNLSRYQASSGIYIVASMKRLMRWLLSCLPGRTSTGETWRPIAWA